jgi:hypothetical protein
VYVAGLAEAVGVEVVGVFLVGLLDVLDEPVLYEVEDGNKIGLATLVEILLVLLDFGHELVVLVLMGGKVGIAGLAHGDLFLEEVGASVDGELAHDFTDDVFAFADAHGIGERVDDREKFLVLGIELVDVDAVGIVPGKGGHCVSPDGSIGRGTGGMRGQRSGERKNERKSE